MNGNNMFRKKSAIAVFVLPSLVLFTAILLIPIIQMFYYSLCDYMNLRKPIFVGFQNYISLFKEDEIMRMALKNSIFFTIFSAVTQQLIGLFLAVLLTNIKRFRNFFKNIYYLPCVLSSAALALLWSFMFNPRIGINSILAKMGVEGPMWLMDTKGFIVLPMWVVGFVATWQYVGQTMMLYMAQISGIPTSLYEAAYIDGATSTQAFWKITLPLLKPMVITTLSLNCIGSLKFFDLIFNMTGGGPGYRTSVLATYLYEQGFKFYKMGYASSIGVVLLVLCLIVTGVINKSIKIEDYEL